MVLWRARRSALTLNTLVLAATATLTIVYHRKYDAILLLPLLGTLAVQLWNRERQGTAAAGAGFLLFFVIPDSILLKVGEVLGASSRWLIVSPFKPVGAHHVLPLNALVMIPLFAWATWVALFEQPLPVQPDRSQSLAG